MSSSSPPTSSAPRRSTRDKKQPVHHNSRNYLATFIEAHQLKTSSVSSTGSRKRKQSDLSEEEDEPGTASGPDGAGPEGSDTEPEDDDVDAEAHKKKPKANGKGKGKRAAKVTNGPPAKKARATTAKATTGAAKGGKRAVKGGAFDPQALGKEMKISTDNPLFSTCFRQVNRSRRVLTQVRLDAIMNPSAALQATVDDFLESLKQSTDLAYAEIINLVLRTCGCNDTVDVDEAVDYDGVVDALDNFTEVLKQVLATLLATANASVLIQTRMILPHTLSHPSYPSSNASTSLCRSS